MNRLMWEGTPGIDSLWRKLERRNEPPKEEARRPASDSEVPDLLADTDNLREIKSVRDASDLFAEKPEHSMSNRT
jgi:hypothetical protein